MLITFLFTSSHCLMPGRTFRWLSLKKRMCMEKAKTTTVDIVAPGQSLPYLSFRDIQRPWAIFWNVYPRVGFSSPHDLSHISWHRAPNWPIYTTTGKTNKARISWHIRRDISMKKKMKININLNDSRQNIDSSGNKNNNLKEIQENILFLRHTNVLLWKTLKNKAST